MRAQNLSIQRSFTVPDYVDRVKSGVSNLNYDQVKNARMKKLYENVMKWDFASEPDKVLSADSIEQKDDDDKDDDDSSNDPFTMVAEMRTINYGMNRQQPELNISPRSGLTYVAGVGMNAPEEVVAGEIKMQSEDSDN